ncbi:hypothetical protein OHA21_03480 [Actinoplanes sp. NBC_00393]|uniref:hypothetical protein n=1 Tax=Actinoplanes sp. NBC_00393 TaxID=2975953 RepID=UPI002E24C1D1
MGVARLDALLERANAALDRAVTQPTAGRQNAEGHASGADGLIQVRVTPSRLESLQIDAHAMRMGSAELAAEIRAAVNRAFTALAEDDDPEATAQAARSAGEALAGELRDIQNESMRSMAMFVQTMQDTVARFEQDRGR